MGSSFTAEMLKFRKRTATWVLLLVLFLAVVLGGYVSIYGFLLGPNDPTGTSGDSRTVGDLNPEIFAALLPQKVLVNTLTAVSRFGGSVVALIFGALAFGSEYNWGTLKTVLSRKPGELKMFAGKILAMLSYFALFSVLALSAGGICSYAIASIEGMPVEWPSIWSMAKAFGAGWLIFSVWGTVGAFLATV
ncbi:MAG: ABC transporter permease subunit, partial [Rubrobacteraceae bacterium]